MIKLVFNLRRRPDVTPEEFHRYWRDVHGPMVRSYAELFRLRRYVQTHLIHTPINDELASMRDSEAEYFDGVAELWWDHIDDIAAALSSEAGMESVNQLLEDERKFIDLPKSPLWMGEEHVIVG